MKRRHATQHQPDTFTASQIRDAYAAARIQEEADAHAQTPEATIRSLFGGWDATGDFVNAKLEQYQRGAALLDSVTLRISIAVQPGTPAERQIRARLGRHGSPVVSFYAGDDGSVTYATLAPKAEPAQVREPAALYAMPA